MKPIDPRLFRASKATSWLVASLVALALIGVALTVSIAYQLSTFVVEVFIYQRLLSESFPRLGLALLLGSLRAILHFAQEAISSFASQRIKSDLRREGLLSLIAKPGVNSGEWSYLLGPGLDSLDVYFSKYLPQLVYTALVTPLFIGLLFFVDPTSAIVLVLTIPLIPIFMVLIGLGTKEAQERQLNSLTRLNQHFLEVLKGINTLRIFNRIERQANVLTDLSLEHRTRTMRVLSISFLSGFALELAASLSVALMAVTIGVRLIDGDLSLLTGLFVLLVAPEAYLPLRQVGAQFHAAQEAVAVSDRILDQLKRTAAKASASLEIREGLTVLVGPSGGGKSTILRSLASRGAYQPQLPTFISGTVRENIVMGSDLDPETYLRAKALSRISELSDDYVLSQTNSLSGGQMQRVNLARAFYKALRTNKVLILDEPLSQLDPRLVSEISFEIAALRSDGFRIIAASHQSELINLADREVRIG